MAKLLAILVSIFLFTTLGAPVQAAVSTASFLFKTSTLTLPPDGFVDLWVSSTTRIGFVAVELNFDPNLLRLTQEIRLPSPLLTQVVSLSTMAEANATGKITVVIAATPATSAQIVAGGVRLACLKFASRAPSATTTSLSVSLINSQVVDLTAKSMAVTATPTSFSLTAPSYIAEYFNNTTLTGTPVLTRQDQTINFDWSTRAPDKLVTPDNFSVRWTKKETLTGGDYLFNFAHDDGLRLYIDGQLRYNQWYRQAEVPVSKTINLSPGQHTFVIEYFESKGVASAKVNWQKI